jgi:hypothetical protein
MLGLLAPGSRREFLSVGGLSALGLTLPGLLKANTKPTAKPAKNCIVLFLLGGPPQHSTWDPKPHLPAEMRCPFGPTATATPGIQIGSLFPQVAKQTDKLCFLRAVSTGDNAHSSSGYAMLTGVPHSPLNAENVTKGAPNDWPTIGGLLRTLRGDSAGLPAAVRLPHHIYNTDQSVWPGQDAGFLGKRADPWLFKCDPASPKFQIPEFTLGAEVPTTRLLDRQNLLSRMEAGFHAHEEKYGQNTGQAFNLLTSPQARKAFDLSQEPARLREHYGSHQFGQSCLLARRLIEAGVSLVQVNWYRGADEPPDNPCWDTHVDVANRVKNVLAPTLDQTLSALLIDLEDRGLLDDTLVVTMAEFGRTPKFNARGGREHWGNVFSIAMAGGGVQGGRVVGASDAQGAMPKDGRVTPADVTATILHGLGHAPDTEIHDALNRPVPASRGDVIRGVF